MIKIKELMIGNLINAVYTDDTGTHKMIVEVNQLDETQSFGYEIGASPIRQEDIGKGINEYEGYEPIEITPDWLIRFGFEKNDDYFGGYTIGISGHFFRLINKTGNHWYCNKTDFYVTYVHQLQNLHLWTKGKELEIIEQRKNEEGEE